MKNFLIRLIFGLLTFGIFLWLVNIFNSNWMQKENFPNLILYFVPVMTVGGWGGWYLYKLIKKESFELEKVNFKRLLLFLVTFVITIGILYVIGLTLNIEILMVAHRNKDYSTVSFLPSLIAVIVALLIDRKYFFKGNKP